MLRSNINYDWTALDVKGKAVRVICLPTTNSNYLGVFAKLGFSPIKDQLSHDRIEQHLKARMQMVANGERLASVKFNVEPNLDDKTQTFAFKKNSLRLYGFIVDKIYFCTHFAFKTDEKDLDREMKAVQAIYNEGEWRRYLDG